MAINDVVNSCNAGFAFDVIEDESGRAMAGLLDSSGGFHLVEDDDFQELGAWLFAPTVDIACLDLRRVTHFGLDILSCGNMKDVTLIYGGERAARLAMGDQAIEIGIHEKSWQVQVRAAKAAKIDTTTRSALYELVPRRIAQGLLRARTIGAMDLLAKAYRSEPKLLNRYIRLGRVAARLYHIEQAGIKVDMVHLHELLRSNVSHAQATALKSIVGLERDGYVYTKFDPVGGKTGRYKTASGFNCMSLPKGAPRECIVSRHDGGVITVIDFNAIDYRCIVDSIRVGDFKEKYAGCSDFHARTTEFLFGVKGVNALRREIIKKITYLYIYGGSEQTLGEATGLSIPKIREVLKRLDVEFAHIAKFRNDLHASAIVDGYVVTPSGSTVEVKPDDHPGKVLGLYAQTYSSWVFEKALISAVDHLAFRGAKSKIMFTVHDEVVVDEHPDEKELVTDMVDAMRVAAGQSFALKVKKGKTYEAAQ